MGGMKFLAPAMLGTLAILVPLVLLYLLKLKRRQVVVSSTALWRQVLQEYRVNHPIQRFRLVWLLIIQALVLAALALAAARLVAAGRAETGQRVLLAIDHSGSMNTREQGPTTRLALAKEAAHELIDSLARTDQVMIVSFHESTRLCAPFTADRSLLHRAVDAIEPTHRGTSPRELLALVESYLRRHDKPVQDKAIEAPAATTAPVQPGKSRGADTRGVRVVLISDGRMEDWAKPEVTLPLEFRPIGAAFAQVGLSRFEVRRDYQRTRLVEGRRLGECQVFVGVRHFAPEDAPAATRTLLILVDGKRRRTATLSLKPGQEKVETFALADVDDGVIEVRLEGDDALPDDDRAFSLVSAPKALGVVFVGAPHPRLERAVLASPWSPRLSRCSPETFDADPEGAVEQADLVIFHRAAPKRLPDSGRFWFVDALPPGLGFEAQATVENPTLLPFPDAAHPLVRFLDDYRRLAAIAQASPPRIPARAQVILETREGPIYTLLRERRLTLAHWALDINDSLWPLENSFVILVANLLQWFRMESQAEAAAFALPGQMPHLPALLNLAKPAPGELRAFDSDAVLARFTQPPGERGVNAATDRAGWYRWTVSPELQVRLPVNAINPQESMIAPARALRFLDGREVKGVSSWQATWELWRVLVALALALALFEWYVFNTRVF